MREAVFALDTIPTYHALLGSSWCSQSWQEDYCCCFFISLTKAYEREAAVASHVAQQSMQFLTTLTSCIVLSVRHHNYMLSFHCHYMGLQGVRQSSCQNDSLVVLNCRRSLRLIKRRRRMLPSLWNQLEKGGNCQSASMHSSQTCAEIDLSIPNALLCAKASQALNGVPAAVQC